MLGTIVFLHDRRVIQLHLMINGLMFSRREEIMLSSLTARLSSPETTKQRTTLPPPRLALGTKFLRNTIFGFLQRFMANVDWKHPSFAHLPTKHFSTNLESYWGAFFRRPVLTISVNMPWITFLPNGRIVDTDFYRAVETCKPLDVFMEFFIVSQLYATPLILTRQLLLRKFGFGPVLSISNIYPLTMDWWNLSAL